MVRTVIPKIEQANLKEEKMAVPEVDFFFTDASVPMACLITCRKVETSSGKVLWLTKISLSYDKNIDIEEQFLQEFCSPFLDEDDWLSNRPSLFAGKFVAALKKSGVNYDQKTQSWCKALNLKLSQAIVKGKENKTTPSRLMLQTVRVESFGPERLDIDLGFDTPYRMAGEAFLKPKGLNLYLKQRLNSCKPVDQDTYDALLMFWRQSAVQRPLEEDPLAALLANSLVQRLRRSGIFEGFSGGVYDTLASTDQIAVVSGENLFISSALFNEVLKDLELKRCDAMVLMAPYLASPRYESRHVRKEGRKDISRTFLKLSWSALLHSYPELEGALKGIQTGEDQSAKVVLGDMIAGEIKGSVDEAGLGFVNGLPAFLCSDIAVLHFHLNIFQKRKDCGGLFFQIEGRTSLLVRGSDADIVLPFQEIVERNLLYGIFLEQPVRNEQDG